MLHSMPHKIAELLELDNASDFSGHSWRRSAASIAADNGITKEDLKRAGRWRSNNVADEYVDNGLPAMLRRSFSSIAYYLYYSTCLSKSHW